MEKIIANDFESIASRAYCYYLDHEIVSRYFDAYKLQKDVSEEHQSRFWQLKYYHGDDKWLYLKSLGDLFLKQNKFTLAFMCFVESLRLNCHQEETFCLATGISKNIYPRFPENLKENKCSISVIMPTYTRNKIITESIQSVLDQSFQDFELIIVNDGGPNDVEQVIRSFDSPKIKYFRLQKNGGVARARNEAILRAEGKYIVYLDDDDIQYPNHLHSVYNALNNPRYKIVYTNTRAIIGIIENDKFYPKEFSFIWKHKFDRNLLAKHLWFGTNAFAHEKSILNEIGMFNEDFRISQDYEFFLRCAEKYSFKHVNKFTAEWRRKHDNRTITNQVGSYFFGELNQHYYAYFKGKIAFLKYYLNKGNKQKVYTLFTDIRNQYPSYFKTVGNISEILPIAESFNDRKFIVKLSQNHITLGAKSCIDYAFKSKSIWVFIGLISYLPIKVIKILKQRLAYIFERAIRKMDIMQKYRDISYRP